MRRHPVSRLLSALLGLWFTLLMVEPVALHACPMHDGGHATPGVSTSAALTMGEAEHHHHPAPISEPPPPTEESAGCLCLGMCAGATGTVLPVAVAFRVAELAADRTVVPALPAHAPVSRGGLVLPFANGPPAAL